MDLAGLRTVLANIDAAGADGFEGLTALALHAATGLHFRLSKSGSQQGTDGGSASISDGIGFECKRYTSDLTSTTVKVKILDLQTRTDVELWVLCATREVSEQLAREVRTHADLYGLQVQIFDWTETGGTPSLALLVSLVEPDALESFLDKAGVDSAGRILVRAVLDDIRKQPGYADEGERLKADLDVASLGFSSARRANRSWLVKTLSDRDVAIDHLRQPIAPLDPSVPHRVVRHALVDALHTHMRKDPSPGALFLLGEEGVGKSWAPLDAWLEMPVDERPMLLMLESRDLALAGDGFDFVNLLAKAIAKQTDRHGNGMDPGRWERIVRRWTDTRPFRRLALTVVVDGINQHKADWGRILQKLSHELEKRNARLVVSSRRSVYDTFVRDRFPKALTVVVPPWTTSERDAILGAKGLDGTLLKPSVADALQNPRLLSTALRLFDNETLLGMHELSKSLLLFEYLRQSRHDSPEAIDAHAFTRHLERLAKGLLEASSERERRKARMLDDIEATAEGRFFVQDKLTPGRYTLSPDGLTLALALGVLDHVREAISDGLDATSAVAELVDPIAALDDVADVVMAAVHAADVPDIHGSDKLIAALLTAFVHLQNVEPSHADGFIALARTRTPAYLIAVEGIWLSRSALPENSQWLFDALSAISSGDPAWPAVADAIERWLRYYTAEFLPTKDSGLVDDENTGRRRRAFAEREKALTPTERGILAGLTPTTGDVDALGRLCFDLLAGRALVPFVPWLFAWAFGAQLRVTINLPRQAFLWLGSHNPVDWHATHADLQRRVMSIDMADLSRTGKRAVVRLLGFCGDAADAKLARQIHLALQAGAPAFIRAGDDKGVEAANPVSNVPIDIDARAEKFAALSAGALYTMFGTTREDHDFEDLLPWMAHARPALAIEKSQAFVTDVPGRDGMPLRQGVFGAERLALAATPSMADQFVKLRRELVGIKGQSLSRQDREALAGECLLIAFPHLSGDEQVNVLRQRGPEKSLWVQHADVLKDASAASIEFAAAAALDKPGTFRRHLLNFLVDTLSPVTPSVHALVDRMLASKARRNRVSALAFLQSRGEDAAIATFHASPWSAGGRDDTEALFGSLVLLRAVESGLATASTIVDRLAPEAYGALALASDEGARTVAGILDAFLKRVSGITLPVPGVELEVQFDRQRPLRHFIGVDEPEDANPDGFKYLPWTPADYAMKAKREHAAFMAFCTAVTEANAHLVLRTLSEEALERIFATAPDKTETWAKQLLGMPDGSRRAVSSIALMLSGHLAMTSPELAVKLHHRYVDIKPLVSMVFDMAEYPLAARTTWGAASASPDFADIALQRLVNANSDHMLATEVIAAQAASCTGMLLAFVDQLIASGHPARMARGYCILGFMDASPEVASRLPDDLTDEGLAGTAATYALAASRSNGWARHWLRKLVEAPSDAEAWPALVLLGSCADARYDLWASEVATGAPHADRLTTGVRNTVRRAAGKVDSARKKTLFGQPVPSPVFLRDTLNAVRLQRAPAAATP